MKHTRIEYYCDGCQKRAYDRAGWLTVRDVCAWLNHESGPLPVRGLDESENDFCSATCANKVITGMVTGAFKLTPRKANP